MLTWLNDLIARTISDLYTPHQSHAFDGPFTRISTPHGTFVLIMSSVWRAETRPHLCHVSFTPLPTSSRDIKSLRFFEDFYPARMAVERRKHDDEGRVGAYTLAAENEKGSYRYKVDKAQQAYRHSFQTFDGRALQLKIDIDRNTPHSTLGPMWISRFFPLPIYWHVFSTRSHAHVVLSDTSTGKTLLDTEGLAHQEKNWGSGFPSGGWLWGQGFCRGSTGSFSFAGGDVNPLIRSLFFSVDTPQGRSWHFGPAGTAQVFHRGPGLSMSSDSRNGSISLVVTDWVGGRRLRVKGEAPADSFLSMSAPMPEGHRPGYCHESFQARYEVVLEERSWRGIWPRFVLVEGPLELEEGAPLEFGGNLDGFAKNQ